MYLWGEFRDLKATVHGHVHALCRPGRAIVWIHAETDPQLPAPFRGLRACETFLEPHIAMRKEVFDLVGCTGARHNTRQVRRGASRYAS